MGNKASSDKNSQDNASSSNLSLKNNEAKAKLSNKLNTNSSVINTKRKNNNNNNLLNDFSQIKEEEDKEFLEDQNQEKEQLEESFDHKDPDEDTEIGYEDEFNKEETINFGKPIKIGNKIWLTHDCEITPSLSGPIVDAPPGWRVPGILDYLKLFKELGPEKISQITDENKLNMNKDFFYVTNTKYNKKLNNGNDPDSWRFKCIGFNKMVEVLPSWSKKKKEKMIENNVEFIKQLDQRLNLGNISLQELSYLIDGLEELEKIERGIDANNLNTLFFPDNEAKNNNTEKTGLDSNSFNNDINTNDDKRLEGMDDEELKSKFRTLQDTENIEDIKDKKNKEIDKLEDTKPFTNKNIENKILEHEDNFSEIDKPKNLAELRSQYKVYRPVDPRKERQKLIQDIVNQKQESEMDSEESFDKEDLIKEFNHNLEKYDAKGRKILQIESDPEEEEKEKFKKDLEKYKKEQERIGEEEESEEDEFKKLVDEEDREDKEIIERDDHLIVDDNNNTLNDNSGNGYKDTLVSKATASSKGKNENDNTEFNEGFYKNNRVNNQIHRKNDRVDYFGNLIAKDKLSKLSNLLKKRKIKKTSDELISEGKNSTYFIMKVLNFNIFDLDTFNYKDVIRCKLVSDVVLDGVEFNCDKIGYSHTNFIVELPSPLYNITTFNWTFSQIKIDWKKTQDDGGNMSSSVRENIINTISESESIMSMSNVSQSVSQSMSNISNSNKIRDGNKNKSNQDSSDNNTHKSETITTDEESKYEYKEESDKARVVHRFPSKGEYTITLDIILFSNRKYSMSKKVWIIDRYEYGNEEIIDGFNYGRPIKIGNQIWLTKDLKKYLNFKNQIVSLRRGEGPGKNGENSYIDSVSACPTGWRLPSRLDYEQLLDYLGSNEDYRLKLLTDKKGFHAKLTSQGSYEAICFDFSNLSANYQKHLYPGYKKFDFDESLHDSISESTATTKLGNNLTHTNNKLSNYTKNLDSSNNFNNVSDYRQTNNLNTFDPIKASKINNNINTLQNQPNYSINDANNNPFVKQIQRDNEKENNGVNEELLNSDFLKNISTYNQEIIKTLDFKDIFSRYAYCLQIQNSKVRIGTRSTSLKGFEALFSTRCIAITENFDVSIGVEEDFLITNKIISFKVDLPNIHKIEWSFFNNDNERIHYSTDAVAEYSFQKPGYYDVFVMIIFFGNRVNYVKKKLTVHTKKNKFRNTEFYSYSQIHVIPIGRAKIFDKKNNEFYDIRNIKNKEKDIESNSDSEVSSAIDKSKNTKLNTAPKKTFFSNNNSSNISVNRNNSNIPHLDLRNNPISNNNGNSRNNKINSFFDKLKNKKNHSSKPLNIGMPGSKVDIDDYIRNDNSNINSDTYSIPKVSRINDIHFKPKSAPICALKESGFAVAIYDENDLNLKVFKCDVMAYVGFYIKQMLNNTSNMSSTKLLKQVKHDFIQTITKPFYIKPYSIPIDIDKTNTGFVLLCKDSRDPNHLYLLSISEKGETIWLNTIMQNENNPIVASSNQLMFFDPETEKPVYGMNTMHSPVSGRISYGKGKICVIFSYYNYFGNNKGEREDHNADTIIIFNEDGTEVNLVSNWNCTHSLTQRSAFDGKFFYTVSLGDAYPQNIKILQIDPIIKNTLTKLEVDYSIELNKSKNEYEIMNSKLKNNALSYLSKSFINHNAVMVNKSKKDDIIITKLPNIRYDNFNKLKDSSISSNNELISRVISNNSSKISKNSMSNLPPINNNKLNDNRSNNTDILNNSKTINFGNSIHLPNINLNRIKNSTNNGNNNNKGNVSNNNQALNSFAYNQNLNNKKIKINMNLRHDYFFCNALEGEAPGNLKGQSSARLGNFTYFSLDHFFLTYSRIPMEDTGRVSKLDEFGVIMFNSRLNAVNKVVFSRGRAIINIKSSRFGNKLFVCFNTLKEKKDNKYNVDYCLEDMDTFGFLFDYKTNKSSNIIKFETNLLNPSDDIITLEDGSVVWPFIDFENNIFICYLDVNDFLLTENNDDNEKHLCLEILREITYNGYEFSKENNEKRIEHYNRINKQKPNALDYLDNDEADETRMRLKRENANKENELAQIDIEKRLKEEEEEYLRKKEAEEGGDERLLKKLEDEHNRKKMKLERKRILEGRRVLMEQDEEEDGEDFNYDEEHGIYGRNAYLYNENDYNILPNKNYNNIRNNDGNMNKKFYFM